MIKALSSIDYYGGKVELKFKGKTKVQSAFGGFVTLMGVITMLFFLVIRIQNMYNLQTEKQGLVSSGNVVFQPSNFTINQEDLEFAAKIYDMNQVYTSLERFVTPIFGREKTIFDNGSWTFERVNEVGQLCGEEKFRLT